MNSKAPGFFIASLLCGFLVSALLPGSLVAENSTQPNAPPRKKIEFAKPAQVSLKKLASVGFMIAKRQVMAPEIRVKNAEGKLWRLSDSSGKLRIINYWATWCTSCKIEIPTQNSFYSNLDHSRIEVVAIASGEEEPAVSAYLKKVTFNLPIYLDPTGEESSKYLVRSIPTTLIIDQEGYLIAQIVGAIDWRNKNFVSAINDLAAVTGTILSSKG